MYMEENSLATELLHEIKMSCKRWFIAFIIMVAVEVVTIAAFLWYVSLPTESYTIEQAIDDTDTSLINQTIGGTDYGFSKTESNLQEESNTFTQE